ncbi:MAG: hypothetical protein QF662_05360, partial [Phycisphaerae bacterium]|nr:hypothetical protein [Phycisphaerae bacterium]
VTIEGIALRKGRQGGRRFINDRLVKKLTESPYTMKTIANPVKHEGEDFKRRPEYKKSVIGTSSGRTSGGGRRGAAAARAR